MTTTFEECDTPEKLEKLKTFAQTFDPPHIIPDHPERLVIVKKDGVWIGYCEIIMQPVVFPAFSPLTKPQVVWDTMRAFVGWGRIQHRGGFVGVPLDTRNFPQKIMEKLGFTRIFSELYRVTNF
jgi:hypothetical protein